MVVIIHRFTKLLAIVGVIIQKKKCVSLQNAARKSHQTSPSLHFRNQRFRFGYIKGVAVQMHLNQHQAKASQMVITSKYSRIDKPGSLFPDLAQKMFKLLWKSSCILSPANPSEPRSTQKKVVKRTTFCFT
ncbi:MAG TPA: hypothetical protein DCF96_01750 [Rhodobacteraceae bacterium]|nr:hypothetical protein [Paracoccaceae bacterium]